MKTIPTTPTLDDVTADSPFADEIRLNATRADAERYRRLLVRWVPIVVVETEERS
jgi:hypothetical protein